MRKSILALIIFLLSCNLFAQWSSNAANPSQISDLNDYQTQPGVSICNSGDVYTAWIEYNFALGYFSIVLQRLSAEGVAQWSRPREVSYQPSIDPYVEWDIASDFAGNCIIMSIEKRNIVEQAYIYKISPSGQMLWGITGMCLTPDIVTGVAYSKPFLALTTNNIIVAAWQKQATNTSVHFQAIDSQGSMLWANTNPSLQEENGSVSLLQLIPSTEGAILLKYFTSVTLNGQLTESLYVKKLDETGNDAWDFHQVLVHCASGKNGSNYSYSDGNGGLILSWSVDTDFNVFNLVKVQHVLSDGSLAFANSGVDISLESECGKSLPRLTYDTTTGDLYVCFVRDLYLPPYYVHYWGLNIQKINNTGARIWGDNGIEYIPIDLHEIFPFNAVMLDNNFCIQYRIDLGQTGTDLPFAYDIKAMSFSNSGQPLWSGSLGSIAVNSTVKLYISFDNEESYSIVTWNDDNVAFHVFAMRINGDGSLGYQPSAIDNVTVPESPMFLKAYPNPCSPMCKIEFYIKQESIASLAIFNLKGQKVRELLGSNLKAGECSVMWDGKDAGGKPLNSGIYIAKLVNGVDIAVLKIVLTK